MSLTRNLLFCLLTPALVWGQSDDAGNYVDDEKRPYKFGFNIEGYQHRFEEKDSKGIIMGEYGFITGDGVYHLTVYATDENGRFRILKMKNTYIGLPMEKTTTTVAPPLPVVTNGKFSGLAACGGCIVPTAIPSSEPPPVPGSDIKVPSAPNGNARFNPNGSPSPSSNPPPHSPPSTSTESGLKQRPVNTNSNLPNAPSRLPPSLRKTDSPSSSSEAFPGLPEVENSEATRRGDPSGARNSGDGSLDPMTEFMSPLMGLLYKFNYTLTFHGHAETGDRAGSKNGTYFVDGQDGFIRNVTYTANEFGYQPNISLIDSNSKEIKQDKENELLWNEFKWFH